MTLKELAKICPSYETIHIGTEHGRGWLFSGTNHHWTIDIISMLERPVVNIYRHEGRDPEYTCCAMDEGLAIIIEGTEDGTI